MVNPQPLYFFSGVGWQWQLLILNFLIRPQVLLQTVRCVDLVPHFFLILPDALNKLWAEH
jgi:hypothetical protein